MQKLISELEAQKSGKPWATWNRALDKAITIVKAHTTNNSIEARVERYEAALRKIEAITYEKQEPKGLDKVYERIWNISKQALSKEDTCKS